MIVQTRYRDIPFEETGCYAAIKDKYTESRWPLNRGKALLIRVPADNREVISGCTLPRYAVVNEAGAQLLSQRGLHVSVCPCIAEIGD